MPYADCQREPTVILKVLRGERPRHPDDIYFPANMSTAGLWDLLQRCWSHVPQDRPTAETAFTSLQQLSSSAQIKSEMAMEFMFDIPAVPKKRKSLLYHCPVPSCRHTFLRIGPLKCMSLMVVFNRGLMSQTKGHVKTHNRYTCKLVTCERSFLCPDNCARHETSHSK